MTTPLHRSLLSHQPTCHLRSDSSFSTGDLQYPLAGPHLLSPTVRILLFPQEVLPSNETTIDPRLLTMPISHSMQRTPRTPPTTPSPMTPTTPQRTPSPALCHRSICDASPQGRPGVARPSKARTKNIGGKECRESQRKHVDQSDGSGQEH